jgi:nicotinate-nucleotide pyrophosphorylase (carboxylating)
MLPLDLEAARPVCVRALEEDLGSGDLTTEAVCPAGVHAEGVFVAREAGVACGLGLIGLVFELVHERLDPTSAPVSVRLCRRDGRALADGDRFDRGGQLAVVAGSARVILTGERLALNLLQRLSGIATLTSRFVDAVSGTRAAVLDTRKTTPGLRALEKYAVRIGGGTNHRFGLFDEAMIKDNHLAVLACARGVAVDAIALREAADAVRSLRPGARITIEVATLGELEGALVARPDVILLDNMSTSKLREAVARVRLRGGDVPALEASGGVTLETVRAIAETGVDRISVGALTHSARNLDLALELHLPRA